MPVLATTVICAVLPIFTAATEKTPIPDRPGGKSTYPGSLLDASATISGTGVVEPDISSVLTPEITGAGDALAQAKLNATSVGAKAAVGVRAMRKLWLAP